MTCRGQEKVFMSTCNPWVARVGPSGFWPKRGSELDCRARKYSSWVKIRSTWVRSFHSNRYVNSSHPTGATGETSRTARRYYASRMISNPSSTSTSNFTSTFWIYSTCSASSLAVAPKRSYTWFSGTWKRPLQAPVRTRRSPIRTGYGRSSKVSRSTWPSTNSNWCQTWLVRC